jgi:hypothetical protein
VEDKLNDNNKKSEEIITGMFSDRASAERAYQVMYERGYKDKDINIIMSDETRKKHFNENKEEPEIGKKTLEGVGTGSVIGGAVGAATGIIAAIGTSVLIPGLGLILAGPIAAGLAGAGAGGLTGGIIGALIGAGIPEEKAKNYEQGIKHGSIFIALKPRNQDDATLIESEWRNEDNQTR